MPTNPSSAPSGPDAHRLIENVHEGARNESWLTLRPEDCKALSEWLTAPAPSGPDVARQIAEQAMSVWLTARAAYEARYGADANRAAALVITGALARALADARREGEPQRDDGAGLITAERDRQVNVEGWTDGHDDGYKDAELIRAAICYAEAGSAGSGFYSPHDEKHPTLWPWRGEWWKPSGDPVRNLAKAGALIAAEIDRLLRQRAAQEAPK